MDTTLEEKLIQFAVSQLAFYNTDHLMDAIPTRESAFTLGVIMAYQMMKGNGDPDEIIMFHNLMEKNKHLTNTP
jgi:hypothetical protein